MSPEPRSHQAIAAGCACQGPGYDPVFREDGPIHGGYAESPMGSLQNLVNEASNLNRLFGEKLDEVRELLAIIQKED